MENIPHLLHTCVINNDEVIEAFSLYYTTHPQPFPFHESVPECFRKFYQLGSRRTRPTLQNLDQEFLQFHKNEKVQRKIETQDETILDNDRRLFKKAHASAWHIFTNLSNQLRIILLSK